MNREDELDLQLARWLEEGPLVAPDRPVAAAIEHARTHPRRRLSRSVLWRSAMDSMHLAPVTPRHTNNLGRALAVAFVAIVVVATTVVLGTTLLGRGGGSGAAPGGAVAPAATATPAPTPTPAPVKVTGMSKCGVQSQGPEIQVGDVEQMRGWTLVCYATASDPRVSGTTNVGLDEDIRADQSADIWGTVTIAGPDGSWTGTWTGLIEKGYVTHRMAVVLQGSGAYDGLEYRYTQTGNDAGSTSDYESTGVIEAIPSYEPGALVTSKLAVSGTETCSDVTYGTSGSVTTVNGVTQERNGFASCTESMSDPRVVGESTRAFNADVQPDGSATWWGTGEITNAGGSWLAVWTGTMDANTNVSIVGTWIGSGGYAGLQYRVAVTSPQGASAYSITGTIEPIQ